MFQNLFIDRLSFWVGFLGGILFSWLLARLRQMLPEIRRVIKNRIISTKENLAAGVDLRFRSDIIQLAQRQHLASPLFSLEEILIYPHLMAPPLNAHIDAEEIPVDLYGKIIPALPDWPELTGAFGAPELTLAEALQKGSNLLVLGNPGIGKTVALAHLALLAARRSPEMGSLNQHLPVYLHAADLPLPLAENKELLSVLIDGAAENVSPLTLPSLGKLLKNEFEAGRALLILDGLDELPPNEINQVVQYLKALLQKYPENRIVVAASPDYYDGLVSMGLAPVAINAWNLTQRNEFLHRWSKLWEKFIYRQHPDTEEIDSLLLNYWLKDQDIFASPLEITLKVWAAYAGDALGPGSLDAIEAYLLRMTSELPSAREGLGQIAAQNSVQMRYAFSLREADKIVAAPLAPVETSLEVFEKTSNSEPGLQKPENQEKDKKAKPEQEAVTIQHILSDLKNLGLIVPRKGARFSLVHPTISAYLAGGWLASCGEWEVLLTQPDWTGKTAALRYLGVFADLSFYVSSLLDHTEDPTQRKKLMVWQWMRDLPKTVRWRSPMMRKIALSIQDDTLPMGIRVRGIAALASTKDPGTVVLFRQFLQHSSYNIRLLGAIGCGLVREVKAVPDLIKRLDDFHPPVCQAALLALGVIANKPALEATADTLLHSDEEMRRTAAEVLATLPDVGHPALIDGSNMEDLLVRRAVVYGLARIRQPWATEILEKMQIEDGQWVVRAAATQALEELNGKQTNIPAPLPVLSEAPWLIMYAGKQGIGVTPGKAAFDLLHQALKNGDENEKLAALDYLVYYGNSDSAPAIYHVLYGSEGQLKEAAYSTLWYIAASGAELPSPIQFGLG
jgi:HEAT repeat protein